MKDSSLVWPIRFGVFEINPRTGELRKQGLIVKLPKQASKLLLFLLERPGEVRTREELRRQLWRADTFVDFELSLNKVIHVLREVLGDSAISPGTLKPSPVRDTGLSRLHYNGPDNRCQEMFGK